MASAQWFEICDFSTKQKFTCVLKFAKAYALMYFALFLVRIVNHYISGIVLELYKVGILNRYDELLFKISLKLALIQSMLFIATVRIYNNVKPVFTENSYDNRSLQKHRFRYIFMNN